MKQPLHFSPAKASEAETGAHLMLLTLQQFGDYLFGFGDHAYAQSSLEKFFRLPANRFSYQHAVFGRTDGEIAAILVLFNRGQMHRSMAATAAQMARVYRIKEIIKFLGLMMPYRDEEKTAENELYIAHLAVGEQFRRQGFGLRLLEFAEKEASAQGKRKLTLLTEVENSSAQSLYNKFGFKITDTIYFPAQMGFTGSAGDVRMEKNL